MPTVLATSCVPLLLGALLSDWAHSSSPLTQWLNVAAWLIAGGGLILSAVAVLLATAASAVGPVTLFRRAA